MVKLLLISEDKVQLIICWWVRASWISVNNCPTRCDYVQFYYISANSSTCFGWYLHPSSGAHVNCNYYIWHWSNRICYLPLSWRSRNGFRHIHDSGPVPDAVITVDMCSWRRVKVSPETCRAVCRNIVAFCWTVIDSIKNLISRESVFYCCTFVIPHTTASFPDLVHTFVYVIFHF